MDREEIRYLLGSTIYARAKAYEILIGLVGSEMCIRDRLCTDRINAESI